MNVKDIQSKIDKYNERSRAARRMKQTLAVIKSERRKPTQEEREIIAAGKGAGICSAMRTLVEYVWAM